MVSWTTLAFLALPVIMLYEMDISLKLVEGKKVRKETGQNRDRVVVHKFLRHSIDTDLIPEVASTSERREW